MESLLIKALVVTSSNNQVLILDKAKGNSKKYDDITMYIGVDHKGIVYTFGYHEISKILSFGNDPSYFIK